MTKEKLISYLIISAMTAAILWLALFATQILLPQLVNFYFLATHYQEAAIGLLMVAAAAVVIKVLSSDL